MPWGRSLVLVLTLLWIGGEAVGEIYKWTDESGHVHFSQDLGQVPPQHRAEASEAAAKPGTRRIQTYTPPASPTPATRTPRSAAGAKKVYRIQVERAGGSMSVPVEINGRLVVPFHIDTGATDVVLPQWAAEKLDLDLSQARTGFYSTANGLVAQKLVNLESVSLGGARVDGVPATVSPSMQIGLLGLSYFNHFRYDIDPSGGVVTLVPNDLAETGQLKGGRSEQQWRGQFLGLERQIGAVETARDEVPSSHTRERARYDELIARLRRELDLLESEADDARVPYAWRQ